MAAADGKARISKNCLVFMKGDMQENLVSIPDSWKTFDLHVNIISTLPQGPKGAYVGWPETGTFLQTCPRDGHLIIHALTVHASRRATVKQILDDVSNAVPTCASVEKSGYVIFSRSPDLDRCPRKFTGKLPMFTVDGVILGLLFSSRVEEFQSYLTYGSVLTVSYNKDVLPSAKKRRKTSYDAYGPNKDGTTTIHIEIVFSLHNPIRNIVWATTSSTVQGVLKEMKAVSNTSQVTDLAMKLSPLARTREETFDLLDPAHPVVSGETYYALRYVR